MHLLLMMLKLTIPLDHARWSNMLEPLTIPLDHNTYNMKRVYEGTIYLKITFKKKRDNVIHIRKKKVELKQSQL